MTWMTPDSFCSRPVTETKARADHQGAQALVDFRPDDDVGDAALIFERHEDDAARRAWTLAHQHQSADNDARALRRVDRGKARGGYDVALRQMLPHERYGMSFQRQRQMPVILDDLLAGRHRRQMRVGFEWREGERAQKRQVVLVAGAI